MHNSLNADITQETVLRIEQDLYLVPLKAGAEVDADLDYGSMRRRYPERVGSAPLGLVEHLGPADRDRS